MDLFDILGPVMIGPSSSHTAGSARIGRVARHLLGEKPVDAQIYLYGSFYKTWTGHGIDRAILGGLLDMNVDDQRIRSSREIAAQEGLHYELHEAILKNAHPNTVVLQLTGESGKKIKVQAASVGGGQIRVESIDDMLVRFSGAHDTLIIKQYDTPGMIAAVTAVLSSHQLNIGSMEVFRTSKGGEAVMTIELDETPPKQIVDSICALNHVHSCVLLEKL